MHMEDYPIVPGRGLVTGDATEKRVKYLEGLGIPVGSLSGTTLHPDTIRHNIESFIGSVEIPVGLVGPLLFRAEGNEEMAYTAAGTLEGALVASMNRGAKAISYSGGFSAAAIHQKMIRSPLFIFSSLGDSLIFKNWVGLQFDKIKNKVEQYSNHAKLQAILPVVTGKSVHLRFVYTTGDAAGQNMTTTCTWHGVLWMNQHFIEECGIEPVHFVIEGNGASDKKVSHFSMMHGRGVHVIAECELDEHVIEKVLRTNSRDFIRCFNQSRVLGLLDGMVGYNINVANAIAAIFVATGQDLASIHEAGVGILNVEQSARGLYCSLSLPSLVIGTVGGGTHLPKQNEALKLMGCAGAGKVERFAKLIAGFALSLEVSTFAAIVSGQFAKSHEKLGRNKPVNWLTKSGLDKELIQQCLNGNFEGKELVGVELSDGKLIENGIMITLTSRVNKKLVGFVPVELEFRGNSTTGGTEKKQVLIKSKPLDSEVIRGLHLMAASIDPQLADLISEYEGVLEYKHCHKKEILLYQLLHQSKPGCIPGFYGCKQDEPREVYLLLLESLDYNELLVINSENEPAKWTESYIEEAIKAVTEVHGLFSVDAFAGRPGEIKTFEPWAAMPLYEKFAQIIIKEYDNYEWRNLPEKLLGFIAELEDGHNNLKLQKTIVHNDFNSRNACIRKDGRICIYDWELAAVNFPHRDIVEFLSFVLPENFDAAIFERYIRYHHAIQPTQVAWEEWKKGYVYSLKEYLVTRVSFYMAGRILMDYEFAIRIFLNSFRMLALLETL